MGGCDGLLSGSNPLLVSVCVGRRLPQVVPGRRAGETNPVRELNKSDRRLKQIRAHLPPMERRPVMPERRTSSPEAMAGVIALKGCKKCQKVSSQMRRNVPRDFSVESVLDFLLFLHRRILPPHLFHPPLLPLLVILHVVEPPREEEGEEEGKRREERDKLCLTKRGGGGDDKET